MFVAIDAGNSQLKMALFVDDEIKEKIALAYSDPNFENILKSWTLKSTSGIGLVSVKGNAINKKIAFLSKKKIFDIDLSCKFPFEIKYNTPETLGIDRVVACTGAFALNKYQGNLLVIDAGTCLTYDVINAEGQYLGGAISPGVEMRGKALNYYTSKLPLIKFDSQNVETIGKNTQQSILSGVLNGIQFEIQGYIDQIKSTHPGVKGFLTGGDSFFFEDALKSSIFAEENLVLIGINELMKTNA